LANAKYHIGERSFEKYVKSYHPEISECIALLAGDFSNYPVNSKFLRARSVLREHLKKEIISTVKIRFRDFFKQKFGIPRKTFSGIIPSWGKIDADVVEKVENWFTNFHRYS